jgi:replicative DNA helicase
MVVFIHRQDKFGILAFEDGSSTKGIAEIILAKNRNGPVDDIRLKFREDRAQFVDFDEFDISGSIDSTEGSQSITLGSKMNNDNLRRPGGGFDFEADINDEPPFFT